MHGTVVDPKEMEPLGRLPELQEVLLPARVWSPTFDIKSPFGEEMFDYFANSKKLVKFEAGLTTLAYLRLGEPGLKRLKPHAQLKDMRVSLVTIKDPATLAPFVNMETLDLNDANITGRDDAWPGGHEEAAAPDHDRHAGHGRRLEVSPRADTSWRNWIFTESRSPTPAWHISADSPNCGGSICLGAQITDASADDAGANEGTARAEYISQPLHQRGTCQARRICPSCGHSTSAIPTSPERVLKPSARSGLSAKSPSSTTRLPPANSAAKKSRPGPRSARGQRLGRIARRQRPHHRGQGQHDFSRTRSLHRRAGGPPAQFAIGRASRPGSHRGRRSGPRRDRPHDVAAGSQSELHIGFRSRDRQPGVSGQSAEAVPGGIAGRGVRLREPREA